MAALLSLLSVLVLASLQPSLQQTFASIYEQTSVESEKHNVGAASKINVVIIGGGMAGISASHILAVYGKGMYDVKILEARNRCCGRMYSRFGTVGTDVKVGPVEMGATWIQNWEGNPIYTLAKQYKVATQVDSGSKEDYYHADGTTWSSEDEKAAETDFSQLLADAQTKANTLDADVSMEQAMIMVNETLYKTPGMQWQCAQQIEDEYGARLSEFSAQYGVADKSYRGTDMYVPGGYQKVPESLLAEAVKTGAVEYLKEKVVTAVDYTSMGEVTGRVLTASAETTVKITCADSTTYDAHVVIVTVPVAVLQAGSIKFTPALSETKAGAISRVGVGNLNKVVLFFKDLTWAEDTIFFGVQDKTNRDRFPHFISLYPIYKAIGLSAAGSGNISQYIDEHTDAEVIALAMEKIRTFMPAMKTVEPIGSFISRWGKDPYSLGSYSYAKVGVKGANGFATDFSLIGEAEMPLLFAGEATTDTWGTVQSAFNSGQREASRVLNMTITTTPAPVAAPVPAAAPMPVSAAAPAMAPMPTTTAAAAMAPTPTMTTTTSTTTPKAAPAKAPATTTPSPATKTPSTSSPSSSTPSPTASSTPAPSPGSPSPAPSASERTYAVLSAFVAVGLSAVALFL